MSDRAGEDRVQEIQQRHDDFVAQYSPGPDWGPCNQMSLDRGWLLTRLRAVEGELAKHEKRIDEIQADQLMLAERENELHAEKDAKLIQAEQRVSYLDRENAALTEAVRDNQQEIIRLAGALEAIQRLVAGALHT